MKPRHQAPLLEAAARSILPLVVVAAMSMSVAFVYGNDDDLGNCVEPFQAAPRFSGLGDHRYPILTRGPEASRAQTYFDQAATMAHWGNAMAAGPDINTGATETCFELAVAAIETAIRTSEAAREHAYVAALSQRYRRAGDGSIAADERAYADAMRAVAQRYPDDLDAATLYAAALMNVDAWR